MGMWGCQYLYQDNVTNLVTGIFLLVTPLIWRKLLHKCPLRKTKVFRQALLAFSCVSCGRNLLRVFLAGMRKTRSCPRTLWPKVWGFEPFLSATLFHLYHELCSARTTVHAALTCHARVEEGVTPFKIVDIHDLPKVIFPSGQPCLDLWRPLRRLWRCVTWRGGASGRKRQTLPGQPGGKHIV